jgi:hypothetical protein
MNRILEHLYNGILGNAKELPTYINNVDVSQGHLQSERSQIQKAMSCLMPFI